MYVTSLRLAAGLSQTALATCVGSNRSTISRLELGITSLRARKVIVAVGSILTSTVPEVMQFLALAHLPTDILSDSEKAQFGILTPATDRMLLEARIVLYQTLLQQAEERERTFGKIHAPHVLKSKIQLYLNELQTLQARVEKLSGHAPSLETARAAARVTIADHAFGKVIVGGQRGMAASDSSTPNLFVLASEQARWLMAYADVEHFAVDDCISIAQSRDFHGWLPDEIETTLTTIPLAIPADLDQIRQQKLSTIQDDYTNGLHYRLVSYTPTFGDPDILKVTLAPLGFFDYFSITPFFDELLLRGADDAPLTIRQKYGNTALTYLSAERGTALIPTPVSLQCVVITQDDQLLLMRRSELVAFYPGHWSASFEETMNAHNPDPSNHAEHGDDRDFVSGAIRGLKEEFAIPAEEVENVRILSLNVEYLTLSVDVILVVQLALTATTLRQRWLLNAWDKNEGSKLAVIPATLEVLIKKLFERDILWHPTSRMRIIQYLFHRFGVEATIAAMEVL